MTINDILTSAKNDTLSMPEEHMITLANWQLSSNFLFMILPGLPGKYNDNFLLLNGWICGKVWGHFQMERTNLWKCHTVDGWILYMWLSVQLVSQIFKIHHRLLHLQSFLAGNYELKPQYSIRGFEWISIKISKTAAFSLQTSENNHKPH